MPPTENEAQRLAALQRYRILDTPAEPDYDDVARLAAQICGTPVALVNFVDDTRVWFKAASGVPRDVTPREVSFCTHVVDSAVEALVVPDTQRDERFAGIPLVVGQPGVRFYVGAPLVTPDNQRIGTVCAVDFAPRELPEEQVEALRRLGRQVMAHLERRLIEVELRRQLELSRETEATLKASEEFKSRIIECSQDCIKVLDLTGRLLFMNAGGMTAVGVCDFAQVDKANWVEFWHPDYQAAATAAVRAASEGQASRFVGYFTDMRGVGKWWDCSIVGIRGIDGRVERLLAVSRDVNEQRKAADLLRAITEGTASVTGEEFYRSLVRYVSEAPGVRHCLVAERRPENKARVLAIWSGNSVAGGESYSVAGAPCATVFLTGRAHGEHDLPHRFPEWTAQVAPDAVDYLAVPIFDSRRQVMGQLAIMDVKPLPRDSLAVRVLEIFASRVGAELERSNTADRLRQAQKMDAIGRLAAGVAHDFNNVLTVIRGNASLMRMGGMSPEESEVALADIVHASDHAANLTRQLLTFSRQHPFEPRDIELNELVRKAAQLLARLIGENIALEVVCAREAIPVRADPGMIEQVLLNLAVNARDALPHGGQLTVRTAGVTLSNAPFLAGRGVAPGDYALLTVADNGTGIAAELLPKIFDPFFTTKPEGKGTGLGLATVFGIVEQHRGFIDVESEVGRGTAFRIYLPREVEGARSPAQARSERREFNVGTEGILVVEDEPAVRSLMRTLLERCGYRVWIAESADAAQWLWRDHKDDIALLITDAMMPGRINGVQLGEQLSAERPGLRVIYCSGYSRDLVASNYQLAPSAAYLAKPFDADELRGLVRRLLDQR